MIPKVVFKRMTPEENADIIKWAFREDDEFVGVKYYTIKYFPELKEIDDSYTDEQIDSLIEELVKKDHNRYGQRLTDEIKKYEDTWKKYNDNYFKAITKYLNVELPKEFNEIIVTVGFIPVFPRHLDNFTFELGTNIREEKLIKTVAHECLHFIWFKKFMDLYPDTTRREMDSPYLPWQYSEMVVDPILNSQEMNNILGTKEKAYDYFYDINYNDENMMEKLKSIYSQDKDIEDKIKEGYQYISRVLNKNKVR